MRKLTNPAIMLRYLHLLTDYVQKSLTLTEKQYDKLRRRKRNLEKLVDKIEFIYQ